MFRRYISGKFILFIFTLVLFSFLIPMQSIEAKLPSEYNIGMSYNSAIHSQKPMVILFYADWCGYCKKFMPNFQKLSTKYENHYNFVMVNVDSSFNKEKRLSDKLGVTGIPAVFIIDPGYKKKNRIPNTYYGDFSMLSAKLDQYLTSRNKYKR